MSSFRRFLMVAMALAAAACGGSTPPAEAPAPSGIDPATAAMVTGRVRFEGPAPEREILRIDGDRNCVTLNGSSEQPGESILVGENNTLQNVFVYVKDGLGRPVRFRCRPLRWSSTSRSAVIVPRVVGIRVGQPLEIRNGDPLLHNVRVGQRDQPAVQPAGSRSRA